MTKIISAAINAITIFLFGVYKKGYGFDKNFIEYKDLIHIDSTLSLCKINT